MPKQSLSRLTKALIVGGVGVVLFVLHMRSFLWTSMNSAVWGNSISADPMGVVSIVRDIALSYARGCPGAITSHSYPFGYNVVMNLEYYLAPGFQSFFAFYYATKQIILSYNLSMFLMFLLNYALTWLAFYLLLADWLVAIIPAACVAFSAYAYAHSWAHLGLLALYMFPLFILAFARMQQRQSYAYAALAGALCGFTIYTSPYYAYFTGWIAVAMFLGHVVVKPSAYKTRRMVMVHGVCVVALTLTVVPYLLDQFARDFSGFWQQMLGEANYGDDMRYLMMSSAQPWDYVLPNIQNLWFGDFFGKFIHEPRPGRDLWSDEFPIYIGLLPTLFGGTLTVFLFHTLRKTKAPASLKAIGYVYERQRALFWSMIFVMMVSFALSLQPHLNFFGLEVPMPNEALRRYLPLRSYSRFAIVFLLALTGLMAMVAAQLRPRLRAVVVAAVVAMVALEGMPKEKIHSASMDASYIKYLRERPERVIMRFERQNSSFQRPIELDVVLADKVALNGPVNMRYGYTELPLMQDAGRFNMGHLGQMGLELLLINGHFTPPDRDRPYLERLAYFADSEQEIWKVSPGDDPNVAGLIRPFIEARRGNDCYVAPKVEAKRAIDSYFNYLRTI